MQGTVLVVDHDTRARNLLKRVLGTQGLEVLTARDAHEALSLIDQARPDLVVIGLNLPGLDGLALCRRLREGPSTARLPIILATGTEIGELEVASGADGVIRKPIKGSEVLAWTHALLRTRHIQEAVERAEATLIAVAAAVEARSLYAESHAIRVADFSARLASATGLGEEARTHIRTAALLRDIGNVAVPDAILTKPGPLTPEEFALVKRHPISGADLCRRLRFGDEISAIVRGHHERWDGTGYPDGLAGEAIPPGARIVSVADAYAAHTTDRPYRFALSAEDALEVLWGGSGSQWDPHLVEAFTDLLREA